MSEQDTEQLEATIPNEELDLEPNIEDVEDVQALKEEIALLREAKRTLTGRAKRAEELVRAKASQPKTETKTEPTQSASAIEETVLLANGMSEELLSELKAVAQVRGTSLIKAQADPIFVAVKDKFEKDKKQQQASMPASRGSGTIKPQKDFKTPGLTREEHRAMIESLNR